MPSIEREGSRDRDLQRKQSFAESGRLSVPMWDSADPDRCPPPLPIPPGSPTLQTRPNASANIQAAAHKLSERARESVGAAYMASISPASSPEKSLIKGAAHRRMQSAHAPGGRDLKSYLDSVRSGSPERSTPGAAADYYSSTSSRPDTPTRQPLRPILSENTPPSATMRALQSFVVKDDSVLDDITNGRGTAHNAEVNAQLQKLTDIATGLQSEMSSLTRRSKDNAADLMGLKEAAKNRDDDIRKHLKDLITSPQLNASPRLGSSLGFGLGLLDSKAHGSPSPLPRAASHTSFVDDLINAPSPFSVEGAASVAMLEKIIREMVTKEGQERLLSNLSELMDKSSKLSTEAVVKVNELSAFIKDNDKKQATVNNALVKTASPSTADPADLKTLMNKIKESVAGQGGMTAEVKALIRELRGEILGMGRELGRKLDQIESQPSNEPSEKAVAQSQAEMQQLVSSSIHELRDHMESLIGESARQSSAIIQSQSQPSQQDMYAMVKHALDEHSENNTSTRDESSLNKEEILSAVRNACENFKPEIELQQYGLERDEILDVLKEGLVEYRDAQGRDSSVDKQQVFDAISEALQTVQMPAPMLDTHSIKADMLASIRECLEEFRASVPVNATSADDPSTRELINDAIRTGLVEHADSTSRVMEISRDDLFDAVKAGLDGSSIPFGGFGEQVLQRLHELVDGMRDEFAQYSAANGRDTEQVLDAVKDGLEGLRGQIETYVDRAQDVTGKDEIIEIIRTGLDNLRSDVREFVDDRPTKGRKDLLDYIKSEFEHLHIVIGGTPLNTRDGGEMMGDKSDILAAIEGMRSEVSARSLNGSDVGGESIDAIKDEIAHLRETLAPLLVKVSGGADRDEMLSTVKEAMSEVSSSSSGSGISTEVLEAIHGEFEKLQSSISRSGNLNSETEEMFDGVRLGLDDLRSHIDKKLETPEKHILNGEILDALSEGLDAMRADVAKNLEKPIDMTVNYEILDTLKEGLAALRSDMEKLQAGRARTASTKGDEMVLADSTDLTRDGGSAEAGPETSCKQADLEKMEVILAQLQIKVEAMNRNLEDMSTGSTSQAHFSGIDATLKEIQTSVADIAAKEKAELADAVTKSDTDAIETLLRNTKSYIETDTAAKTEQIDAVEALARVAKDGIDALTTKVDDNIATKADVAVVEVLASDIKTAMEDLKEKTSSLAANDDQRVTKTEIDVIGVICTEIKDKVLAMALPDPETLPEKADIEQLTGLINDLRDGHEKFRETYDKDIGVTAKAFDDRAKDTEQIVGFVTAIKELLGEFREHSTERHETHQTNLTELKDLVTGVRDNTNEDSTTNKDVKALMESVNVEFEKAHASLDALKNEQTTSMGTHMEHKDAIVADINSKIDARLDEVLAKYDDVQRLAAEKSDAQEAVLTGTRDLADELKLSIDTLGTTLTASSSGFIDATEKISQDSKTVYNKVDDVYNKLDETQLGLKGEHQAVREDIAKAITGVTGIQADMLEHNPKILLALKELHALVAQHYEHSQKLGTDHAAALKTDIEDIKTGLSALPRIAAAPEESARSPSPDAGLHEKLDKLVERAAASPDADLHAKLDKIIDAPAHADVMEKLSKLAEESTASSLQIERLDAIQAQMTATAVAVSAFVATQTQRLTDEHAAQEREADELALVVAQKQARKDSLDEEITALTTDRAELQSAIVELRGQKDGLLDDKAQLNADMQALHAALSIRREELSAMDAKADALEKRIMEGLMNQARSSTLTSNKNMRQYRHPQQGQRSFEEPLTNSPRRSKGRDLRIPSTASDVSTMPPPSIISTVTNVAAPPLPPSVSPLTRTRSANARPSMHRGSAIGLVAPTAERRIMSLGQISHNAAAGRTSVGGDNNGLDVSAPRPGLEYLKRSQSVRTSDLSQGGRRKSSWNGASSARRGFTPLGGILDVDGDGDKENSSGTAHNKPLVLFKPSGMTQSQSRPISRDSDNQSFIDVLDGDSESRRTSNSILSSLDYASRPGSSGSTFTDANESIMPDTTESEIASMVAREVTRRIAAGDLSGDDEGSETETETESSHVQHHGRTHLEIDEEREVVQQDSGKELVLLSSSTAMSEMIEVEDFALRVDVEKKFGRSDRNGYGTPADSGLGSDLPTAALEFGGFGFGEERNVVAEKGVVLAGHEG